MNVVVRNLQDRPTLTPRSLARAAEVVRAATGAGPATVGVAFVADARMLEDHARYLGDPSPTDVLSFPTDTQVDDEAYWGDLVICTDQALRQARTLDHPYQHELLVLFVHGLLHLLGHDHTQDRGEMRTMEEFLRPRCTAGCLP